MATKGSNRRQQWRLWQKEHNNRNGARAWQQESSDESVAIKLYQLEGSNKSMVIKTCNESAIMGGE